MNKIRQLFTVRTGAVLTILISLLLVWFYFTPVVKSLNTTLFSTGGDGLKSYYSYLYHIKEDPSALKFNGMNYPWGETVFYTDNQPYLSITMRSLCKIFPGLFNYSIAVWNGILLLSIALAALILYLIFIELGLPAAISLLGGIGITMLSPQISRMGAHFSLSYSWVIPLAIYLLLKFSRNPSYKYSIVFFFLILWSGATHMYFIGIMAMLIFLFWIFFGIGQRKTFGNWRLWLPHLMIQLILPILIIQLLVNLSADASDRASYPFGFFYYRAYPESVFLPADRFYGQFIHKIITYSKINWEGYAYIGILATVGCAAFLGKSISRLFRNRFKTGLAYDNSLFLSYLFWGSFLILLYSFGIPFILGLEKLVDYIGPVRQMRSIGRFAWVFYYSMNILVIFSLWKLIKKKPERLFPKIIMGLAFLVLFAEAHVNFRNILPYLNNKNPEFTDFQNKLPRNQWANRINPDDYQSILTLPYFHIGSESIWKEPACSIDSKAYLVSFKTGLPLHAVMMSRTSLSQTYKSLELIQEPYRSPEILDELPSDKPILVLSTNCIKLGVGENIILQHCQPVETIGDFTLSRIDPDSLRSLANNHIHSLMQRVNPQFTFSGSTFHMYPVTPFYVFNGFEDKKDYSGYESGGSLALPYKTYGKIFDQQLTGITEPAEITVSFWVKNIRKDNMARLQLEAICFGPDGNSKKYVLALWGQLLKQLDGPWGLIELQLPIEPGQRLKLTLLPGQIRENILIDNLLIRKTAEDIYGFEPGKGLVFNNRFYPIESLN